MIRSEGGWSGVGGGRISELKGREVKRRVVECSVVEETGVEE